MRTGILLLLSVFIILPPSCKNDTGNDILSGRDYSAAHYFLDSIAASGKNSFAVIDSLNGLNTDKFRNAHTLQTALAGVVYTHERFALNSSKEAFLIAAVERAKEKNWKELHAEALQELANYVWVTVKDKTRALQYYNTAYLIYKDFSSDQFPQKFACLYQYGVAYFSFEEYDRASSLFSEALALGDYKADRGLFVSASNTLGLCYRHKGEYNRALEVLNNALGYAKKNNIGVWQAILGGNIGTIYYLLHKPDAARPLLETEVVRGTTKNDWTSAASAQLYLAEIELDAGNISTATTGLLQARQYLLNTHPDRGIKTLKQLFDALSRTYKKSGDFRQALLYADSAKMISDSIQKILGANILLNAQNEISQATFLEKKKAAERISRYTRNMLIGGIILLAIISVLFMLGQRKKYFQKQKNTEQEKEKIARELEAATRELNFFAQSLEEKNNIIEKIGQLQTDKKQDEEKYGLLSQMEKSVLLTDEQWTEFTSLFEKVYGNFLLRLKDKVPAVSPAEIRIIALTKLKLSNKTMAGMLGITPDAVRMNKFRIRKKLNLEEDGDIERFLESV